MLDFGHELGMLEPWIHHYGVATVFIVLTFESCGIPLPGESLLIVAAMLSGRGDFSVVNLCFSAWAGAVFGDNIGYLIGRMLGQNLLRRYGGKIGLNAERIGKIETIFAHYGPAAVGFARFFSVLRQLNGVVAGTVKMDWWRFLIFNALGGALWVLVWVAAGLYLGTHAVDVVLFMHKVGIGGAIFAFVALLVILTYGYRDRILARLRRDKADKTKDI